MRMVTVAAVCAMTIGGWVALTPGRADAFSLDNPVCGAAGALSGPAAAACSGIGRATGGQLLRAGKQLLGGNVGGAVNTAVGGAAQVVASSATTAIGLAAIGTWVVGGAEVVLGDTAAALGETSAPQLRSTWFSSTYWRMAAIAAVLTLPFLFAAAVQALIRSDLALLGRAAFGYLPLAMLATAIAAPLTMLLLAASDQLCSLISSAAGDASAHFLARAGIIIGGLTAVAQSPFLAFLVGLFTIAAAFALWIELLMREAAVYVVVLMLPLAFAGMVWPARRIWAVRGVELLVALILSKFAIVAVLSLGGAAISAGAGHASVGGVMAGAVLITLAAFSPWAMVRLVPLAELASGAAGPLRAELARSAGAAGSALDSATEWSEAATAAMRRESQSPPPGDDPDVLARPPVSLGDGGGRDDGGESGGAAGGEAGGPAGGGGDGPAGGDGDGPAGGDGDGPAGGDDGEDVRSVPETEFARQPALELGPANLLATPVYPHRDAS
jgi:type IV secretion system protein TrbL